MAQPNVIVIIADDLAWGDLGCHGNPHVRTPNLDRLQAESTRFTRYLSGPVCTPARASLMTGRYPYRTRAIDTFLGRSMMDPEEVTLAETLRAAGYRTCISGKWHLGDRHPMRAFDKGFEEALVHDGGGLRQPGNPTDNDGYFDPDLWHNGALVPTKGYCTDIFTDHALGFMEAHQRRAPASPFFCYLATNAPHTPLEVDPSWLDRFRGTGLPEPWARLYAMVENLDANVGRVLGKLEALGIAQETVVIFTSDHGPCASVRAGGENRFNGNLRGRRAPNTKEGCACPVSGARRAASRPAGTSPWWPTPSICSRPSPRSAKPLCRGTARSTGRTSRPSSPERSPPTSGRTAWSLPNGTGATCRCPAATPARSSRVTSW